MSKDLHGQAILDYYKGLNPPDLIIHNNYGPPEQMPVEVFFRDELDFSTLEHLALIECKGKVLDLGAGAGAHALVLQSRNFDVTAIENSPGCCEVMRMSGVNRVVCQDYEKPSEKYDTILILMNGMGLAGTLDGVLPFLHKCKSLLRPDGQILVDSSDISYLYEDYDIPKPEKYLGEIRYQYEYKKEFGDWFDWLYVDQKTLEDKVRALDLSLEILYEDENDQYLARIS